LIRFTVPDAGYEVLDDAGRDNLVDVEVARELSDGSLVIAGRPPRWWKATNERRALVLAPDARATKQVFGFTAGRYDVADLGGTMVIVKEVQETGSDGGNVRVVQVERATELRADAGTAP
jgi:hypothetical protein